MNINAENILFDSAGCEWCNFIENYIVFIKNMFELVQICRYNKV